MRQRRLLRAGYKSAQQPDRCSSAQLSACLSADDNGVISTKFRRGSFSRGESAIKRPLPIACLSGALFPDPLAFPACDERDDDASHVNAPLNLLELQYQGSGII
jgi:hypothetical protein